MDARQYAPNGDAAEYSSVQVEQQNGILYRHNCQQDPSLQMICGHYRAGNQKAAAGFVIIVAGTVDCFVETDSAVECVVQLNLSGGVSASFGQCRNMIKSMCEILLLFALRHLSSLSEQQSLIRLFSDPALSKGNYADFHNLADNYTIEQLAQRLICRAPLLRVVFNS